MRSDRGRAAAAWLAVGLALASCTGAGDRSADRADGAADGTGADPQRHGGAVAAASRLPVAPNLNVLVVSFDALRADALGCYGAKRGATRNIDAFAAGAVVFTDAYSAAPATPTSFASFWSGLLPTRVFLSWRFVAEDPLAALFSAAGYSTAAFINNVQLAPERGFDAGFDLYDWRRNDPDLDVLASLVEWLGNRPAEAPFFAWAHFLRPHAPYFDRPRARHLYRQKSYSERFARWTGVRFEVSDPRDAARVDDLYHGEVWAADQIFGELVGELRRLDLLDSTLVLLTADHGEELGEHGGYQHGRLYEEHLRIPFILHHPGLEEGRVSAVRARSIDVLPTLLQLVGRPVPEEIDGRSLAAPGDRTAPVVAASMTSETSSAVSLLDGTEKLIVHCLPELSAELYELGDDPAENDDLSERRLRSVRRRLNVLSTLVGGPPCEIVANARRGRLEAGLDEASVDALRALGYLR